MAAIVHSFPFDPTYGYSLEQLLQIDVPSGPCDLADFWEATYTESRQTPLRLASRRIACKEQPGLEVFEVEFDSWGGRRIGAWLTVPHGVPIEQGMVVGHGYGGREGPDFDLPGPACAAIFPCARGLGRSKAADLPDEANGHVLAGIESRETYVHRGCVADLWGAASALIELFPQTAQSLHYRGTSFGGGTGAMAIAWDARFASAYLCVPSFGNHPLRVTLPCTGSGESVRQYFLQHPEVMEVLAYFDAAAIARHIKIPVLCDCALFDPTVPPPGQFSVYNALRGSKELIVRSAGHFDYPPEQAGEEECSRALQNAWFGKRAR